jgi:uncharacterized protein YoxC
MKKLVPLAILASAVGAAAVYLRNNQKQVEKTLDALEELSESAEDTVASLSEDLFEEGTE